MTTHDEGDVGGEQTPGQSEGPGDTGGEIGLDGDFGGVQSAGESSEDAAVVADDEPASERGRPV
jgi:hypothetical protein